MRVRKILALVFVALILIIIFIVIVRRSGEFSVATGPGDQGDFQVISDGQEGAVVVWVNAAQGKTKIQAQRINNRGDNLWAENSITVGRSGNIREPKLAQSKGNIFVGWIRQEREQLDLWVQKISAQGRLLWGRNGITLADGDGDQRDLQLVADGYGGVYAAYTNFQKDESHVRVQRLNTRGRRLWGAGKLVDNERVFSLKPFIMVLKKDLVVAWEQQNEDLSTDIWAQRFDTQGRKIWANNGRIVVDASRQEEDIRMVSDGAGGFYAAWEDNRSSERKVFAQRLDQKGSRLWPGQGVAVSTAKGEQWHPEITLFDRKDLIVVWKDMRTREDDIYAQRIDSRGRRLWPAGGLPITIAKNDQSFFKIAGSKRYVFVVWRDERGQDQDIYAQKINGRGKSLWMKDGRMISGAKGEQQDPQIIIVQDEKVFVDWSDFRNSKKERDIYGQVVD